MAEKHISAYFRPMLAVTLEATATGIETPNCESCIWLSSDDDGSDYPTFSWPICSRDNIHSVSELRSFPFKKPMRCWESNFWHSKFAALIQTGSDQEMLDALNQYREAVGWELLEEYGDAKLMEGGDG